MATIAQIVEQIRHAVFGKDVRENIAEGIEKCYEDSTANAQIALIEAKGAETIESIPDDYTKLSAEVVNLKSALNIDTEAKDFNDLQPLNRPYFIWNRNDYQNAPPLKNGNVCGTLYCYLLNYDFIEQIFVEAYSGSVFTRLKRFDDKWDEWTGTDYNVLLNTPTDLDTLVDTKTYVVSNGILLQHRPTWLTNDTQEGLLIVSVGANLVVAGSSIIQQTYISYFTGQTFTRYKTGTNAWTGWQSFAYKPNIVSGDDLNDFVNPGIYGCMYDQALQNSPPVGNNTTGFFVVIQDSAYGVVWQVFFGTAGHTIYSRHKTRSGWNDWAIVRGQTYSTLLAPSTAETYDANDWIEDGIYRTKINAKTVSNMPPSQYAVGTWIIAQDPDDHLVYQTFIETYTGKVYTRLRYGNGNWREWKTNEVNANHEISILFVGNSLTQDGIAYLPYLLKHYYPEIDFKFYMWYNGGKTLEEQYAYFTNNLACDIFSVSENVDNWTNYDGTKTMSAILNNYHFDVVCLQDYFNYKDGYSSDSDMEGWENCKDYITSHYAGGNGLEFILLFHAPKRDIAATVFARELSSYEMLLQKTITEDMIANGIAVYRALSTELNDLGDQGGLSPDGTHTQEGLPCLLQTFVSALWIFERLGIEKSVYGCPLRITTDIYNAIHVPGPNIGSGVITGTDAQNLLAQEVAIKAYKEGKYYVQNNSFVPPNGNG